MNCNHTKVSQKHLGHDEWEMVCDSCGETVGYFTAAEPAADCAPRGGESRASERQVAGDHYKAMDVQPWDVIDTWPRDQRIGAYRAGALKYLMRMGSKDENAQEIAKGQHYMEKLLEVLRSTEPPSRGRCSPQPTTPQRRQAD